jgi:hypothetical protein
VIWRDRFATMKMACGSLLRRFVAGKWRITKKLGMSEGTRIRGLLPVKARFGVWLVRTSEEIKLRSQFEFLLEPIANREGNF